MTKTENLSFEAALTELESIIAKLEKGDVELEQSIDLYERGAALKKHCEARLAAAQEKIEKVVGAGTSSPAVEAASFD